MVIDSSTSVRTLWLLILKVLGIISQGKLLHFAHQLKPCSGKDFAPLTDTAFLSGMFAFVVFKCVRLSIHDRIRFVSEPIRSLSSPRIV